MTKSGSEKSYFVFLALFLFIMKFTLVWMAIFWENQKLHQLLTLLSKDLAFSSNETFKHRNYKIVIYLVAAGLVHMLIQIDGLLLSRFVDSPSAHISRLFHNAVKRFHLTDSKSEQPQTFVEYFATIFEIWERCSLRILYWTMETLLSGPVPLTIWLSTKHFQKRFQTSIESTNRFKNLISCFSQLKQVSNSLKAKWSIVFLVSILQACAWLMLELDENVENRNLAKVASMLALLLFCTIALCLSGEVFRMVRLSL